MAVEWPTPRLTNGHLVDDEDWNQHVDNLDDLNSRVNTSASAITAINNIVTNGTYGNAALDTRLNNLQTISQAYGRWYSTATSTHTSAAQSVGSWTAIQALSGVSVSGGDWTFNTTGVYEITFGWHASFNLAADTGFNVNPFIADSALNTVYAQSQDYFVQYATGALECSNVLTTGPVAITSGLVLRMHLGSAQDITVTGTDGLRRTFVAIKRIS